MKSIIIIMILSLLIGCMSREPKKCVYTSNELIERYGTKVFGTNKNNKTIVEFRDKGIDSIQAGYYTFYDNGYLKSYRFFVNMDTYVYGEEYDTLGKLIKVEGDPFVFNVVELNKEDSFNKEDSLFIRLYLFDLNKKYKKINVISSDNRNIYLKPVDDTLYSNMKTASFSYNHLKKEKDIVYYIYAEYENTCTNENKRFKDSISLHYKPH